MAGELGFELVDGFGSEDGDEAEVGGVGGF